MNMTSGTTAPDPETQKTQPQADEIEASILIVDAPFPVDGNATPFGQRWGGECVNLTAEHLAALQAGKTLALDVQNEYVTFVRLETSGQGGGAGPVDPAEAGRAGV